MKDGEVISHGHKKTVWVKVNMPETRRSPAMSARHSTKEPTRFKLENYAVKDYLAPHPYVINVDVEA